jgi:hypothetical protein
LGSKKYFWGPKKKLEQKKNFWGPKKKLGAKKNSLGSNFFFFFGSIRETMGQKKIQEQRRLARRSRAELRAQRDVAFAPRMSQRQTPNATLGRMAQKLASSLCGSMESRKPRGNRETGYEAYPKKKSRGHRKWLEHALLMD